MCCMQIQWAIFQRVNIITEEKGKTGMKGKKKKRILPKNKTQKGKMQYKKYFLGKHTCGCTLNCHECYHLLSGECENKTCLLKLQGIQIDFNALRNACKREDSLRGKKQIC